ncbi:DUF6691 family protein [Mesonia mobilis]|uniref:Transporter n=1 Tax=Mesonia mobilis TaxID=369791 RepID=A0ABQ3BQH6_9FLAO|nr:DUF6691 family protein [Mesonia mobilis]MBQ0738805.1 YeeE/YedE family protein [Aquimarina celericrescens]GGZ51083.1 transporter [Mesonia mobilis]
MKTILYLFLGTIFGIIMYKSEAASWFRIYEMFNFASFHMYGIMGSAVAIGMIGVQFLKKKNYKAIDGSELSLQPKEKGISRYLLGGIIFGLGWGLAGACPGPMYTLAGVGYISILIVIAGAILGTFLYGLLRKKLPH